MSRAARSGGLAVARSGQLSCRAASDSAGMDEGSCGKVGPDDLATKDDVSQAKARRLMMGSCETGLVIRRRGTGRDVEVLASGAKEGRARSRSPGRPDNNGTRWRITFASRSGARERWSGRHGVQGPVGVPHHNNPAGRNNLP